MDSHSIVSNAYLCRNSKRDKDCEVKAEIMCNIVSFWGITASTMFPAPLRLLAAACLAGEVSKRHGKGVEENMAQGKVTGAKKDTTEPRTSLSRPTLRPFLLLFPSICHCLVLLVYPPVSVPVCAAYHKHLSHTQPPPVSCSACHFTLLSIIVCLSAGQSVTAYLPVIYP